MNTSGGKPTVEVNGRSYAWPDAPVVVVCIDGSEPDYEGSDSGGYIERAIAAPTSMHRHGAGDGGSGNPSVGGMSSFRWANPPFVTNTADPKQFT